MVQFLKLGFIFGSVFKKYCVLWPLVKIIDLIINMFQLVHVNHGLHSAMRAQVKEE